jgi:hypothetical protein
LSDKEVQQVERETNIVTRFETQSWRFLSKNRFPFFLQPFLVCNYLLLLTTSCFSLAGKMGERYTLSQESDDRLLEALGILELNCDLARKCISSVRGALKRVFLHFFLKDTQPEVFSQLAQHFLEKDDLALAYRQASLKIGVEGTIAFVVASSQKVN